MPTAITPTDISPGTTGSYQSVDITSNVGSDAGNVEAVHLRVYNGGTGSLSVGVRATSSTDDEYDDLIADAWYDWTIGVDSNDTFECHIESSDVEVWMWGYSTTDEAEFLTDGDDFESDLTEGSWSNVDQSANFTETVEIVFGSTRSTGFSFGALGLRPDTSTDATTHNGPRSGSGDLVPWAMYCNSETFEMLLGNLSERTVLLNGIIYTGVTGGVNRDVFDPHDNTQNNTWQTQDITSGSNVNGGDTFVLAHAYATNSQNHTIGLRPDSGGPSHTVASTVGRQYFSFIPLASGDNLDLFANDGGQADPRVALGIYATADESPAGGATEVNLAGSQPASTGALSVEYQINLAGSQPASSGSISAEQTLAISVAGSQPASTGAITGIEYSVSLTGSQPASSGALTSEQTLLRSVAGSQPASTGALSVQQTLFVSLAGNQPASAGAISNDQSTQVALAGSQPASTGALTADFVFYAVSLTGSQPAPSGALSAQQTLNVSVAGSQPASTGALTNDQALAVNLAGSQPASTGALTAQQILLVTIAGSQPAASGAISAQALAPGENPIVLTGKFDHTFTGTGQFDHTLTLSGRH